MKYMKYGVWSGPLGGVTAGVLYEPMDISGELLELFVFLLFLHQHQLMMLDKAFREKQPAPLGDGAGPDRRQACILISLVIPRPACMRDMINGS